jgi:hypothetical protein
MHGAHAHDRVQFSVYTLDLIQVFNEGPRCNKDLFDAKSLSKSMAISHKISHPLSSLTRV